MITTYNICQPCCEKQNLERIPVWDATNRFPAICCFCGNATVSGLSVRLEDLMKDGLSQHDLQILTEIIRENYGTWFHANLMRCLHILLPHADGNNIARLELAYPGSVAAYRIWYNNPMELAQVAGRIFEP